MENEQEPVVYKRSLLDIEIPKLLAVKQRYHFRELFRHFNTVARKIGKTTLYQDLHRYVRTNPTVMVQLDITPGDMNSEFVTPAEKARISHQRLHNPAEPALERRSDDIAVPNRHMERKAGPLRQVYSRKLLARDINKMSVEELREKFPPDSKVVKYSKRTNRVWLYDAAEERKTVMTDYAHETEGKFVDVLIMKLSYYCDMREGKLAAK